ncbi:leucyl/phenylalanyl-tRNA--protein transferase [Aliamphritea spongicola]|uniref:leucyl/phenylalanyl-tRNA--protein transferase n=1 Tax=Aliamphritea spongicola TaxID=707589 RepID=UPI00196B18D8|nr:leucyl/phenylalanyl-tRNA--protein transferase [Aliamphritea spongicola]MBN3561328.1 leucyl/phenylalanyl-tRNA--protein transferase [Aliamphritea spongicola]
MIPWLTPECSFPPIEEALEEPNGLLAAGADLSPERLLSAYRQGIFPWFADDEPILWWSPNPRCVMRPEAIHLSKSLRKRIRREGFDVSFDNDFAAVIKACAEPRPGQPETWITEDIQQAYINLHRLGHAHSVEVREDGQLVGGLYGIAIGKLFFGESMFSRRTDASKIAYVFFAKQLQKWGYALIDCQVYNDHLASLGAEVIPRTEFKQYLDRYLDMPCTHSWQFDLATDDIVSSQ